MLAIILFFSVGLFMLVLTLSLASPKRHKRRISAAQEGMTANHFQVRMPRTSIYLGVMGTIINGFLFSIFFFVEETVEASLLFMFLLFIFYGIIATIRLFLWKLEVTGSQITFRSLLRRQEFSFYDIAMVQQKAQKAFAVKIGDISHIVLWLTSGKKISVSVQAVGYEFLVKRLMERDIPGAKNLKKAETSEQLEGEESPCPQKKVNDKRSVFLCVAQLLLFFLSAIPLLLLYFSETWIFAGAYTAWDILESYRFYYTMFILAFALWFFLQLIGNSIVIFYARRKKSKIRVHLAVAGVLLGIVGLAVAILILPGEGSVWEDMRVIRAEMEAIEEGKLLVTRVNLDLDSTQNPQRSWRLLGAETKTVYRSDLTYEPFFLHFPTTQGLSALREQFRSERYVFYGRSENIRILEMLYTPNLHLVVEINPITGREIPPEADPEADNWRQKHELMVDFPGFHLFDHDLSDTTFFQHIALCDFSFYETGVRVSILNVEEVEQSFQAMIGRVHAMSMYYRIRRFDTVEDLVIWRLDTPPDSSLTGMPPNTIGISENGETALLEWRWEGEHGIHVSLQLLQAVPNRSEIVELEILFVPSHWVAGNYAVFEELSELIGIDLSVFIHA